MVDVGRPLDPPPIRDSKYHRKPIAALGPFHRVVNGESEGSYILIVCDDGSVWERDHGWRAATPLPGSFAAELKVWMERQVGDDD